MSGRVVGRVRDRFERGQGLDHRMMMTPLQRANAIAGLAQVLLSVTTAEEVALSLVAPSDLGYSQQNRGR
jgi:hypothetical protein